jgi:hypothetical protein
VREDAVLTQALRQARGGSVTEPGAWSSTARAAAAASAGVGPPPLWFSLRSSAASWSTAGASVASTSGGVAPDCGRRADRARYNARAELFVSPQPDWLIVARPDRPQDPRAGGRFAPTYRERNKDYGCES